MCTIENEIINFDEVVSTQQLAKHYIKENKATHGLVLSAKKQTGGIGRLDRRWSSPLGGLWMTTIYESTSPIEQFQGFSIRLGLELTIELEKIFPVIFQIKWPNDLILEKKKVGGMIIDTQIEGDKLSNLIIGLGINVNNQTTELPSQVASIAISLGEVLKKKISIETVQVAVLIAQNRIFQQAVNNELKEITSIWCEKSLNYQKKIHVNTQDGMIQGIEQGITENGELIIKTNDGKLKPISVGDIVLV